jgi:hypothetical protein
MYNRYDVHLPVPVAAQSMAEALVAWKLGSWVRIPLKGLMFVVVLLCVCVVFSCVGKGICDLLIIRPKESYQVF